MPSAVVVDRTPQAGPDLNTLMKTGREEIIAADLKSKGAAEPSEKQIDQLLAEYAPGNFPGLRTMHENIVAHADQGKQVIQDSRTASQQLDTLLAADLNGKFPLKDGNAVTITDTVDKLAKGIKGFAEFGMPTPEKDSLLQLAQDLTDTRLKLLQHREDASLDPSVRDGIDKLKGELDVADSRVKGIVKTDLAHFISSEIATIQAIQSLAPDQQSKASGSADTKEKHGMNGAALGGSAASTLIRAELLELYNQLGELNVDGARATLSTMQ